MRGIYNAHVIFGCNETNHDMVIDKKWLEDNYPGIQIYAINVHQNYLGYTCYGVSCDIDIETGLPAIECEKKQIVLDFFKDYCIHKNNDPSIKLGYYCVLYGSYKTDYHVEYNFNYITPTGSTDNAETQQK